VEPGKNSFPASLEGVLGWSSAGVNVVNCALALSSSCAFVAREHVAVVFRRDGRNFNVRRDLNSIFSNQLRQTSIQTQSQRIWLATQLLQSDNTQLKASKFQN